jgi:hypothetical protein
MVAEQKKRSTSMRKRTMREPAQPTVADSVDKAFGLWRDTKDNTVTDGLAYEREIRREWDLPSS